MIETTQTFTRLIPNEDVAFASVGIETHLKFFNIFNEANLHREFFTSGSTFGILRLLAAANRWSISDLVYLLTADELMRAVALLHYHRTRHSQKFGKIFSSKERLHDLE